MRNNVRIPLPMMLTGICLTGFFGVLFAATPFYSVEIGWGDAIYNEDPSIVICHGAIRGRVGWAAYIAKGAKEPDGMFWPKPATAPHWRIEFDRGGTPFGGWGVRNWFIPRLYRNEPGGSLGPGGPIAFVIPIWIPLALCGVPTALLIRRARRRGPPGHCDRCGYNLTGNISGVCPECGTKTGAPAGG